jgi:hypothetical protein
MLMFLIESSATLSIIMYSLTILYTIRHIKIKKMKNKKDAFASYLSVLVMLF